jgi:hypothetical protein
MAFVAEKLCLNQPGFSIEWPAEVIDYDLYDGDDFRPLKHVSADIAKVFS